MRARHRHAAAALSVTRQRSLQLLGPRLSSHQWQPALCSKMDLSKLLSFYRAA